MLPSVPDHGDGEPDPHDGSPDDPGTPDGPDEMSTGSAESHERPTVRQPRIRRVMHPRTRDALAWTWVLLASLTLALLMRTFLVAAFLIPSESMESVLEVGDRLLVSKLSYRIGDPSPGDIVVFHTPPNMRPSQTSELVKRVVAVEGQMVQAIGSQLFIDGHRVAEPYLPSSTYTRDFGPNLVPTDHVFVMGDNRTASQDSRYFGTVPESEIVGRAFARFWPLSRLGGL
ncbi:signal peptidase I [Candidatus Poriferisodalis sp.]|uniref:signal peptidase I n=1 Tax=Candidatus Poriferisodalis sp. TaxID=3101277 RepID=UPI003D1370DC